MCVYQFRHLGLNKQFYFFGAFLVKELLEAADVC